MAESDNKIADAMQSDDSWSSSSSFEILPSENDNVVGLESGSQTKQFLKFNNLTFHLDINDNRWILNISGTPCDLPFKSDQKVSLEILRYDDLCLNVDGDLFSLSGSSEGKAVITPVSKISHTSPPTHIETNSESCKCKKGEVQSHTVLSFKAINTVVSERHIFYDIAGNETKKDSNNENQKIDFHNKDERWTFNVEGEKTLGTKQPPSQISDDEKHIISEKRHYDIDIHVSNTAGSKPVEVDAVGEATKIRYKNSLQESEMDEKSKYESTCENDSQNLSKNEQHVRGKNNADTSRFYQLKLTRKDKQWSLFVGATENIFSELDGEEEVSLHRCKNSVYLKAGERLYYVSVEKLEKATITQIEEGMFQLISGETGSDMRCRSSDDSHAVKIESTSTGDIYIPGDQETNLLGLEKNNWFPSDDEVLNKQLKNDKRMAMSSSKEEILHAQKPDSNDLIITDKQTLQGPHTVTSYGNLELLRRDRRWILIVGSNENILSGFDTEDDVTLHTDEDDVYIKAGDMLYDVSLDKSRKATLTQIPEATIDYQAVPNKTAAEVQGQNTFGSEAAKNEPSTTDNNNVLDNENKYWTTIEGVNLQKCEPYDDELKSDERTSMPSSVEKSKHKHEQHLEKLTGSRSVSDSVSDLIDSFGKMTVVDELPVTPEKKGVENDSSKTINSPNDDRKCSIDASANQKSGFAMVCGGSKTQASSTGARTVIQLSASCIGRFHTTDSKKEKQLSLHGKLGIVKSEPKMTTSSAGDESPSRCKQVSIISACVRVDHDETFNFLSHSKIVTKLAEKNEVQIKAKKFDEYQGFEISGDYRSVAAAENMLKDILHLIVSEPLKVNVGEASYEKVTELLSQLKSEAEEKYKVVLSFDISNEKLSKKNGKTENQSGSELTGKSEQTILKTEAPKKVSWLFPSGYQIALFNSQIEHSIAAVIVKFRPWNGKEKQISSSQVPSGFGNFVTHAYVGLPFCNNTDNQSESLKELLTGVLRKTGDDMKSHIAFDLQNIQTWSCLKFLECLLSAVWSHFKSKDMDKPVFVELWNAKGDEYQAANFHCLRLIDTIMGKEIDCLSDDPMEIQVVEGSLDRTKAEVLVNTTSPDLQLNQGAVSVALLKAAGKRLQDECSKWYPRGINWGEIAVTHGYGLPCTFVFHGALPPYKANYSEAEKFQTFRMFMHHCLTRASDLGCRSIAFPVLGTGNLKYPVKMVAAEMFMCVEKFQQSYKRSTLRMVYFIVYETDTEVLKTFSHIQKDLDAHNRKGPYQQQPERFVSEVSETDERADNAIESVDVELTGLQQDMTEAKCFVTTRLRRDITGHKHVFIMPLPTSLRRSIISGDDEMQDGLKQKLKNLSAEIISTDSSFLLQAESFESLQYVYLILKEPSKINDRRQSLPDDFHETSVAAKICGVTKTDFRALKKIYRSTLDKYVKNGNAVQYEPTFVLIQGKGGDIESIRYEIEKLIAYIKKLEKVCIDIPEAGLDIVKSVVEKKEAGSNVSCIIFDREQCQLVLYGRQKQPLIDFGLAISDQIKNATDKQNKNSSTETKQNYFFRSQNSSEATDSRNQDTFIFKLYSGRIKVTIREADLLRMRVDCIVNAANEYLNHNAGVAAAVAAEAGPQLQKDSDIHVRRHGKVSSGDIVVAVPGKLPYRCVIHGVGPNWRDFQPLTKAKFRECQADIQSVILKALDTVNKYKWKSVAIPAISSGYLGVPGDVCALQYFEAVKRFSSDVYTTGSFVEEICFVSLDRDLVKLIQYTFTAVMIEKKVINLDLKYFPNEQTVGGQLTDQGASKMTNRSSPNVKPRNADQNVPSLDIKNRIKTKESKQSGKILPEPIFYQSPTKATVIKFTSNQELQMYSANILEMKLVDAVVVCDDLFGTGKGNIANGLKAKAGPKYISEKQNAFRSKPSFGNVIVTGGGDSQFRYVFHALLHHRQHFPQNITEWYNAFRKMLICIFRKAVNCNYHTVAMPVIGTDTRMQDISEYARVLLSSYKSFCIDKPTEELTVHLITKEPNVKSTLQTLFERYIIEEKQRKSSRSSTTATNTNQVLKSDRETEQQAQRGNISEGQNDCVICLDTIKQPKKLACGHAFCQDCIAEHLKTRNSCPVCGKILGKITGNQPHGNMKHDVEAVPLPGYEKCKTIKIEYTFTDGIQRAEHPEPGERYTGIRRVAFLPDNEEGQQVLKLLYVAFERRLTFTIGQSRTTGRSGVITWNDIHHKTDVRPNAQFGYPDPTYFDRVKDELAAKGVTLDDIK